MLRDFRFAFRVLLKSPFSTVAAISALALAIGANTAMFAVVKAVLLRHLNYPNSDRLLVLTQKNPRWAMQDSMEISLPMFRDWESMNHSFSEMAAVRSSPATLSGAGEVRRVHVVHATANIFDIVGRGPMLGGGFLGEEQVSGHAAVLSYRLWQRNFGGASDAIGKEFKLDREVYRIAGVLPRDYEMPAFEDEFDLLIPVDLNDAQEIRRENRQYMVAARLKPGITYTQAQANMQAVQENLAQEYPATDAGWAVNLIDVKERETRYIRPTLNALFAVSVLVLLLACTNVAGLLIARLATRTHEFAIRSALGATRRQLARMIFAESTLVALCGCALGLVVARWGMDLLHTNESLDIPDFYKLGLDWPVLLFSFSAAWFAAVLSGLMPALRSLRVPLELLSRGSTRTYSAYGHARVRSGIVAGEIALSLVLIASAALMIRSFRALLHIDPGFDPQNLVVGHVVLDQGKYSGPQSWTRFSDGLEQRLINSVGAGSVTISGTVPFDRYADMGSYFYVEGQPKPARITEDVYMKTDVVADNFFSVMRIPLLSGRIFNDQEKVPTAIVNRKFVERYWPHENPLGKHIYILPPLSNGSSSERIRANDVEVVGVMPNVAQYTVTDDQVRPEMWVPVKQNPVSAMDIILRCPDTDACTRTLRSGVASMDSDLLVSTYTLGWEMQRELTPQRFALLVLNGFALFALLICAVGIYAVISYVVAQRTQELGIRMALGASSANLRGMVLREGMKLIAIGVVVGVGLALGAARLIAALLYGVRPRDPLALAVATLVLTAVALLATYVPARRATQLDPLLALRAE